MAVVAAAGASKPDKAREADTKLADTKVTVAGMQVSIDPKTGRLRPPTLEESQALARVLRQQFGTPSRPLEVIQAANGALAVELSEDYMETILLRTHPDGTQTLECMSAPEAARIIEEESSLIRLPGVAGPKGAVPGRTSRTPSNFKAEKE